MCKNIFIDKKYGFWTGSSITNYIFKQSLLDSFKEKTQTDVIYIDLLKVFDKVDHRLLILKLKSCSTRDPLLSWFRSFFNNGFKNVKYENFISDNSYAVFGISQSDHLLSLIFY